MRLLPIRLSDSMTSIPVYHFNRLFRHHLSRFNCLTTSQKSTVSGISAGRQNSSLSSLAKSQLNSFPKDVVFFGQLGTHSLSSTNSSNIGQYSYLIALPFLLWIVIPGVLPLYLRPLLMRDLRLARTVLRTAWRRVMRVLVAERQLKRASGLVASMGTMPRMRK